MKNPLVVSLLTALCFGGWPLISRAAAGASPLMVSAVVATVTATVPLTIFIRQGTPAPISAWAILIIAGIVNGFGMLMYGGLISNRQWSLSTWVPLVVVLMVVVTALGGALLYNEPLSLRKCVGIALAAAAVWLMR